MTDFIFYFTEGWKHIISTDALDHQLFILALAVIYTFADWKRVLILVTAFTIGHSLTLALSVLDIIALPSSWVEVLIPVTIALTALWNIWGTKNANKVNTNYFLALFFGLIHGLGFANSIRMILAKDQSLAMSLLGFNVGLEAGQIIVVLFILCMGKLLLDVCRLPRRLYVVIVSIGVLITSIGMVYNRLPFTI